MPERSVIVERFRFNQRKQCDEETVMVYSAELQKLSINCTKIQKFLLDYKKLTFAQARDIEVSMELAKKTQNSLVIPRQT